MTVDNLAAMPSSCQIRLRNGMERDEVPVRSVARAIDVLMALADGDQTLGAVAKRIGLSKGTCHRILSSLTYQQLAVQDRISGNYSLGPGCYRFVEAVTSGSTGLGALTRPHLEQLWAASQETVTLHVRVGAQRICVEELPSPQHVRYVAGLGSSAPIYVGSAGRVLLAFLDDPDRSRVLSSLRVTPLTDRTVASVEDLERELADVRALGWAESRGERVTGAAAISAPIFDAEHRVLAALSVLGPEGRFDDERRFDEMRGLVVAAASACTAELGGEQRPSA